MNSNENKIPPLVISFAIIFIYGQLTCFLFSLGINILDNIDAFIKLYQEAHTSEGFVGMVFLAFIITVTFFNIFIYFIFKNALLKKKSWIRVIFILLAIIFVPLDILWILFYDGSSRSYWFDIGYAVSTLITVILLLMPSSSLWFEGKYKHTKLDEAVNNSR